MNDSQRLHRIGDENEEQFIWRICQLRDSGQIALSWDDVADIINSEFRDDESEYRSEAAYRKPYQQAKRFYEAGVFNSLSEEAYFKELQSQKEALEKEQVKVRDERNELRRVIREEARKESYKDQFLRSISEHVPEPLIGDNGRSYNLCNTFDGDNDLIVTFYDIHTGLSVNNHQNVFNQEVLKDRMNRYLDKIVEVRTRHDSQNCYVILSELVSGLIHMALRIENNQNLIEQFLTITDYLSDFLEVLHYHFEYVHVFMCPGNHSRVQAKKEDNMRGENMDFLAMPFLEAKLKNFDNIVFHENTFDSSIAQFTVRDNAVCAVHGDKDSMDTVVQKLTMYTGRKPDIIFMGHRHTNAMLTSYDVKVLQAGCMSGGGDEYCMDKRLRNKPEQIIAVVNNAGLDCVYDVKFD